MDGIFMWAINQNIWNKKYHYQYTLTDTGTSYLVGIICKKLGYKINEENLIRMTPKNQ